MYADQESQIHKGFFEKGQPGRKLVCALIFPVFTALFSGAIGIRSAEAVQIKKVQTAKTSFQASETVLQQGLADAIDVNQSLLLMSVECDDLHPSRIQKGSARDGGEGPSYFTTTFQDNVTVTIERDRADVDADLTADVQAYTVEFNDGVQIHKGSVSFGPADLSQTIMLPVLQADSYFPLITLRSIDWFVDEGHAHRFKATFPNDTELKIERLEGTTGGGPRPAATVNLVWQVVEFLTDASVRSGEVQIGSTSSTATVALSPPITNLDKTFLIFNYTGGKITDGVEGLIETQGTITNASTLTFKRAASSVGLNREVDIAWYLVELEDESYVQKGSLFFLPAEYSKAVALDAVNPIDLTRSFPIISASTGTPGGDTFLHNAKIRADITHPTTLTLSRHDDAGVAEIAAGVDWFVVEFAPLTLKNPNGGEQWKVGEAQTITWKHASSTETGGSGAGGVHRVKLLLSKDGGADGYPLAIAGDVAAGQSELLADADSFSWTIPQTLNPGAVSIIGNNLKVKIVDTDMTTRNFDVSNSAFEIGAQLSLVTPNGGEVWRVGEQNRNIVWTHEGSIGDIKILYSINSGADGYPDPAQLIAQVDGTLDSFNWNPDGNGLPNLPFSTLRIKIESVQDNTIFDASDADFEIMASIALTHPQTTTTLIALQNTEVAWTHPGGLGSVTIKYTTSWSTCRIQSGSNPCWVTMNTPTSAANLDPDSSPYVWFVPDFTLTGGGADVGIRIQEDANPDSIYDTRGPFAVKGSHVVSDDDETDPYALIGQITVTDPTFDEVLRVGGSKTIQWETPEGSGDIYIYLSKTGPLGLFNVKIVGEGDPSLDVAEGQYVWADIPDERCNSCAIAVFAPSDPDPSQGSAGVSAVFSIKADITDVRLDRGPDAVYQINDTVTIHWTPAPSNLQENVRFKYSRDGDSWTNLDPPTARAAVGTYDWLIPDEDLVYSTMRIRVELIGDETHTYSDSPSFTIKGRLTLMGEAKNDPDGEPVWKIGEEKRIVWMRHGSELGDLQIRYSKDDGADGYPYLIATRPSGDGSYTWCVGYTDECSGTIFGDAAHDPELVIDTDKNGGIKIGIFLVDDADTIHDKSTHAITIQKAYTDIAVPSQAMFFGPTGVALVDISWTTRGPNLSPGYTQVLMSYDKNSGLGADGTPGTADDYEFPINNGHPITDLGQFSWEAPKDALGSQIRIRVKSAAFPDEVYGDMATDFALREDTDWRNSVVSSFLATNVGLRLLDRLSDLVDQFTDKPTESIAIQESDSAESDADSSRLESLVSFAFRPWLDDAITPGDAQDQPAAEDISDPDQMVLIPKGAKTGVVVPANTFQTQGIEAPDYLIAFSRPAMLFTHNVLGAARHVPDISHLLTLSRAGQEILQEHLQQEKPRYGVFKLGLSVVFGFLCGILLFLGLLRLQDRFRSR